MIASRQVIPVPDGSDLIVTLPPAGVAEDLALPQLFESSFVLLSTRLAELLRSGPDTVDSWVRNRFRVSRFEATDILPRAVRRLAPQLLQGVLSTTMDELANAWVFILEAVASSRRIESTDFWQDIGRFPVFATASPGNPPVLAPAFLAFWPDALLSSRSPFRGVPGLRRVDEVFFTRLLDRSGKPAAKWTEFFTDVGVSGTPVLRRFSRVVTDEPAAVDPAGRVEVRAHLYQGERQADENRAVMEALAGWPLWHDVPLPSHEPQSPSVTHHRRGLRQLRGQGRGRVPR